MDAQRLRDDFVQVAEHGLDDDIVFMVKAGEEA